MLKFPRCLVFTAAVAGALTATPAAAQELKLSMANGRVTLVAREVPIGQILAEWARLGDTRIINGEKLMGRVTLELVDYPEGRALDLLLRQAAGYITAPRPGNSVGASVYDRIMILPTSRPPAVTAAATPPPYNRNLMPQPMPQPVEDDDREPADQGAVPPAGMVPQGMPVPGQPPLPGAQQGQPQQQPVFTAPRPGMMPPPPQQGVPNPYAPPGTRPQVPPGRPGSEGENR
jgi:hypothetical protein